jgi:hypothetical protein
LGAGHLDPWDADDDAVTRTLSEMVALMLTAVAMITAVI